MRCARSLLLISLATIAISTDKGVAQSLFSLPDSFSWCPFVYPFPGTPSPSPETSTYLPPDADPNYSTPGGFDKDVDVTLSTRRFVNDQTGEPPGTLTIDTRQLVSSFLSLGDGRAIEYGIGVGRRGFCLEGELPRLGEKRFGLDGPRLRECWLVSVTCQRIWTAA